MSTAIIGNINDLTGTAVTSNCYVRFWLRGCNGNQPRVGGAALIAPDNGPTYWQDFVPNGSGQISGTLYSNDVNISAGGQVGVTWYDVQVFLNGQGGSYTPYSLADGTTFNLNSAIPITTNPVVATPTGDTTYLRLDGGNANVTAAIPYSATPVFALRLSPSILTVFTITLTGNVTSSTLTGATPGIIGFKFTQPAGGNSTFVYPTNVKNGQSPDPTANAISFQAFFFDGTNAYPIGDMTVN
jgi:hypothetical protein